MSQRILFLLLLSLLAIPAQANVYTLISDAGLTYGYGFSGTITTDGSIGTFSDATAITEWNITLQTPDNIDGISDQVLNSGNSNHFLSPVGNGQLKITLTELSITNSEDTQTTNLFFVAPNENLSLEGPRSGGSNGFATVVDGSENPSFSSIFIGDAISAPFAFRVPEPTALWLALTSLLLISSNHRRRSTMHRAVA